MRERFKRITSGMTLTELLIVITILMLLALLSFLAVKSQIAKGHDARRKSDIYQIKVAVEEYEKDHNCYPTSVSCEGDYKYDLQPYIPNIPCDPVTKASYFYFPDNSSICPNWYWVFTNLDNDDDPAIDDLGCANGCGYDQQNTDNFDYYDSNEAAPNPSFGQPDISSSTTTTPPDTSSSIPATSPSGYYGCTGGICQSIEWIEPGISLECGPAYSSPTCFNFCLSATGQPQNECM